MIKLRPTEGTVPHRRGARYHIDVLTTGGAAIHAQLAAEMRLFYVDLKAKARATEDAEDDWLGASARTDAAELALKNAVRRLATEAKRADQGDASLNAGKTIFPQGFGTVVAPEGELLLKALPGVYVRVAAFVGNPDIAGAVSALELAQKDLEDRLKDDASALAACNTCFAEEQEARRRIREQLDSAHGRLRDFYKGRTHLAEDFFLREKKTRKPATADGSNAAPKAPAAPAATTPATPVAPTK
ncbi:MAG: hypothetical protein QM820_42490 [Minicystis sp.]